MSTAQEAKTCLRERAQPYFKVHEQQPQRILSFSAGAAADDVTMAIMELLVMIMIPSHTRCLSKWHCCYWSSAAASPQQKKQQQDMHSS